jgi:hypothetical protein
LLSNARHLLFILPERESRLASIPAGAVLTEPASALSLSGNDPAIKPATYVAYQDLKTGVPSMLLTIEMAFFAVVHLFAFP